MKSACEKKKTTKKKVKIKLNLRLADPMQGGRTAVRARGSTVKPSAALVSGPFGPFWAAGPQRQESPFNLNTYHHDNNLVTLSEANLFISRCFFLFGCCFFPLSARPPGQMASHSPGPVGWH